ncbi:MAG TPA: GTP 3',8-cyclase MoaA [Eubacteriales bacterium]|jgi:cyclic pyranopterin phosphate synthase|nr:GTP 3',8-cyclase MoaA [Clostridia bacterium]HRR90094.1 GTP 3',8-cyclase MoaA [Eubacteriales bacterium]HRU83887.1 GTP 3',8-cyclase MoaA [Eubacteriales bacterium]
MKDGLGREINYARISVTDLCNLRCRYCMPEEGILKKEHREILSIEKLSQIAASLAELGFEKIRVTGGEPLVRRGIDAFLNYLGGLNFATLALTTNGMLLSENVGVLKSAGVDLINVSLDTLNAEKYRYITCRGDLAAALAGIESAIEAGVFQVKINAVLLKGINDNEVSDFIRFSESRGVEVRFIELMPFSSQRKFAEEHFIGAGEIIKNHPELEYFGSAGNSTAEYYKTKNGGLIGFIRPMSKKFCAQCNRIRITADGMLLTCLHNNGAFDLKPYIGGGLTEFIKGCIQKKQSAHRLEDGELQCRDMKDIGG